MARTAKQPSAGRRLPMPSTGGELQGSAHSQPIVINGWLLQDRIEMTDGRVKRLFTHQEHPELKIFECIEPDNPPSDIGQLLAEHDLAQMTELNVYDRIDKLKAECAAQAGEYQLLTAPPGDPDGKFLERDKAGTFAVERVAKKFGPGWYRVRFKVRDPRTMQYTKQNGQAVFEVGAPADQDELQHLVMAPAPAAP